MTDQKHNILEVRDLVVDFPIFGGIMQRRVNSVHAVRKVSFDLIKGETLGIVGESGSGKSTVGNAILNVLRLTAPDVDIDGHIFLDLGDEKVDILNLRKSDMNKYRKHIQMIFQDPYSSLNPRMLVKDIIKESLDINSSLNESEKMEKVHWLLDKVGLSAEQSNRYPHEFSGGQRQRIGIARALYLDPPILLLDEATSSLDNLTEKSILKSLEKVSEQKTIIMIAHRLSTIKNCDNILYLEEGKLIAQGIYDELMKIKKFKNFTAI